MQNNAQNDLGFALGSAGLALNPSSARQDLVQVKECLRASFSLCRDRITHPVCV